MSIILTLAGWAAAFLLAAVTVSAVIRLARRRDTASWLTPLLYGCAALIAFTVLGVIGPLAGALLAAGTAAAAAWLLLRGAGRALRVRQGRKAIWRVLASHVTGGIRYLREDTRSLLGRVRSGPAPQHHQPAAAMPVPPPSSPQSPVPPARQAPPAREVPSVRDDPVLGEAPAPEQVAEGLAGAGIPVPPPWAALCDWVAEFDPDTDEDLIGHVAGEAAGVLAYAGAVRARADTLLHGTGLDPAYVAGHLEFADEFAELAAAVALVDRRFHEIYGALREWVDEHPEGMPHKAREWLQGGAAPQQDTEPGDGIAA